MADCMPMAECVLCSLQRPNVANLLEIGLMPEHLELQQVCSSMLSNNYKAAVCEGDMRGSWGVMHEGRMMGAQY